jgi:hypothetical protein
MIACAGGGIVRGSRVVPRVKMPSNHIRVAAALLIIQSLSVIGQATPESDQLPPAWETVLRDWEKFILFSVNPSIANALTEVLGSSTNSASSRNKVVTNEPFQGYLVLGKVEITERAERNVLINAFTNSLVKHAAVKNCFNPRHGIRATKGTNTVDVLICFECGDVFVESNTDRRYFQTTDKAANAFNSALLRAGISVAR